MQTNSVVVIICSIKSYRAITAELRGMIADRSYHRLLHLDWIQVDVDGDGLRESVPHDDSVGSDEPTRAYELTWEPSPLSSSPRRFYFDGSVYDGWSNVPQRFRDPILDASEPSGIAPVVFSFKWEL